MPVTLEEASQALRAVLDEKESRIDWQLGYLGDGAGQVYTARENYLLVRYPFSNSPAAPVYCNVGVAPVDGLRVVVGYLPWEPGKFQIIKATDQRFDINDPGTGEEIEPIITPGGGTGYNPNIGPHWANHMYLGVDPALINWRQISPLGVFPTSPASLSVTIKSGYIPRPGADTFVVGQSVDLTSHVPGSGARYVLISYDSTGAVEITNGSIQAAGRNALNSADIPDTPSGNWRSAAIILALGQTEIKETRERIDIYDLRFPEETTAGSVNDEYVLHDKIGSPTHYTLHDDWVIRGSSGVIDGTLTYVEADPGAGTHHVKVNAGEGYLRATNDQQGELKFIAWTAATGIEIPTPVAGQETTRFIGVEYNSGSPQYTVRTTFNWNWYDDFPLARVSYDGTTLRILNAYAHAEDTANFARRFNRLIMPFQREVAPEGSGGLILSNSGTRNIAMTAGNVWHGFNRYVLTATDTSVSGSFDTHYRRAGGGFNSTTGVTQWPNTQYDDGSGTLATLDNNKYMCLWFYVDVSDSTLDMMYGRNQYNSASAAQAETVPDTPAHITAHGRLIGRFIIQKSASTPSIVESAWSTTFTGAVVSPHNDLSGLQGGTVGEYYHLTSAEYTKFQGIGSGTAGRLAEWLDSDTLQASTLIKSGAGLLTLSAASDQTLTLGGTLGGTLTYGVAGKTLTVNENATLDLNSGVPRLIIKGANLQIVDFKAVFFDKSISFYGLDGNSLTLNQSLTTGGGIGTLTWPGGGATLTIPVTGTAALGAGTLTVSTTNDVTGASHTHAITSSSSPGAAASILATDSSGNLTIAGTLAESNTTDSTSTTTGAIQVAGGLGVAKTINCLRLGAGAVPASDRAIAASVQIGSGTGYGIVFSAYATAAATGTEGVYVATGTVTAGSYTLGSAIGVHITNPNKAASTTITTAYGINIDSITNGDTNYAIFTGTGVTHLGGGLRVGADGGGAASTTGFTNATDTTITNTYLVRGGQAANTVNTGWIKIFIGTNAAWIPYWQNATP